MIKKILFVVVLFSSLLFAGKNIVVLQTNQGDIELQLFPKIAPKTCLNFETLVKRGYYDGVIFHRVIKNFMIQSGDPTGTGRGGKSIWGKPFKDEFKPNVIFNKPFYLAMANRGKNTNGSQFFITTVPTPWLNGGYTIFGRVIKGFKAVKKIEYTPVNAQNRPISKQYIIKAKILNEK